MAEYLTDRQRGSLRRRILRHIRGMLIDMDGVEKNPHGVRWIGEAPVSEGVGGKQMGELIVDLRDRNWKQPQQTEPK